jgi:hypothetical protein
LSATSVVVEPRSRSSASEPRLAGTTAKGFATFNDEHRHGSHRPHRIRPRIPGVQRHALGRSTVAHSGGGRQTRAEQARGKIPTVRAMSRSNLQLATDSARTTVRPPKTSSRRHSLTGIGLTCDDTFSPRANLQLNPLACRELRVTTLIMGILALASFAQFLCRNPRPHNRHKFTLGSFARFLPATPTPA